MEIYNLYLHLTEKCNNKCIHCYNGERLENPLEMNLDLVQKSLSIFKKFDQVTLTGGEVFLSPILEETINIIKSKYEHMRIRIDTNGCFNFKKFRNILSNVDEIRFSIDGPNASIHDSIRGNNGAFSRCSENIKMCVKEGYDVEITTTIQRDNLHTIDNIITLCNELGVKRINFHIVSAIGYASVHNISITEKEIINIISIINKHNDIKITYPKSISIGEHKCFARLMNRFSIFPNGDVHLCALHFTNKPVFKINNNGCLKYQNEKRYGYCSKNSCQRMKQIVQYEFDNNHACIYDKISN